MIIFNGIVSKKCKNYIIGQSMKGSALAGLIILGIGSIPFMIRMPMDTFTKICCGVGILFGVAFSFFLPLLIAKKGLNIKIEIENDLIITYLQGHSSIQEVADIKRILDKGEWYVIDFYIPHADIVCQKDLIVKGTIEEFEQLFADYIVREKRK